MTLGVTRPSFYVETLCLCDFSEMWLLQCCIGGCVAMEMWLQSYHKHETHISLTKYASEAKEEEVEKKEKKSRRRWGMTKRRSTL